MTFTEQQQIFYKEFLKYYAGDTDSAKAFIEWCKYEVGEAPDPNTPTRPVGATEQYPHTANRRVICLTAQQWLKRFKEQCDILEPNTPDQYWKAARIAACLEDDENA